MTKKQRDLLQSAAAMLSAATGMIAALHDHKEIPRRNTRSMRAYMIRLARRIDNELERKDGAA